MAKNTKIPTLQEMEEYIKNQGDLRCYDLDHNAMLREMTRRIFSVEMSDDIKVTAWKFCKALAGCLTLLVNITLQKSFI